MKKYYILNRTPTTVITLFITLNICHCHWRSSKLLPCELWCVWHHKRKPLVSTFSKWNPRPQLVDAEHSQCWAFWLVLLKVVLLKVKTHKNGNRFGAVVRALAFHQCVPGSIPGLGAISGLSLLVLYSAPKSFSPIYSGFPLFKNQNLIWFENCKVSL